MSIRSKILMMAIAGLMSAPLMAQNPVIWTGGISEEERAEAPTTGTRLVFFVSAGNYLSDITVRITDSDDREVVDTTTTGPWLILNLPAGRYNVQATRSNGDVQGVQIEVVAGTNAEFGIMFPES
jgi:hypothetical protein